MIPFGLSKDTLMNLLSKASCDLKHTVIVQKHFPNTKMPAEMQMKKRCKTIKTRSTVPSNVSERTRITRSSGEIITYIQ